MRFRYVVLLCLCSLVMPVAQAAKMKVSWVAPTTNTDGSSLTDLTGFRIEWGSCKSDGSFGVYQAGLNVSATATSAYIYPTALDPVCAHVFAINSANLLSVASNVAQAHPPVAVSKPKQL